MKTKTNKVPLVGPKGRSELIERVRELEKQEIIIINIKDYGFPDLALDEIEDLGDHYTKN